MPGKLLNNRQAGEKKKIKEQTRSRRRKDDIYCIWGLDLLRFVSLDYFLENPVIWHNEWLTSQLPSILFLLYDSICRTWCYNESYSQ